MEYINSAARFQTLLDENGGTLSVNEAASLLGISTDELHVRAGRGQLLLIMLESELSFPAFQLSWNQILPGMNSLLSAMKGTDPREITIFLLRPIDDISPIALLRDGNLNRVMQLANLNLQQIGA